MIKSAKGLDVIHFNWNSIILEKLFIMTTLIKINPIVASQLKFHASLVSGNKNIQIFKIFIFPKQGNKKVSIPLEFQIPSFRVYTCFCKNRDKNVMIYICDFFISVKMI